MATTKDPPDPPGAFTPEQKTELSAMIAEAVAGAKPPGGDPPAGPPKVTDDEWAAMSDRSREGWVRNLVGAELARIAQEDDAAETKRKADAAFAATQKPQGERAPTVLTRLGQFLWGKDPAAQGQS